MTQTYTERCEHLNESGCGTIENNNAYAVKWKIGKLNCKLHRISTEKSFQIHTQSHAHIDICIVSSVCNH